jgi:hypothetical protein
MASECLCASIAGVGSRAGRSLGGRATPGASTCGTSGAGASCRSFRGRVRGLREAIVHHVALHGCKLADGRTRMVALVYWQVAPPGCSGQVAEVTISRCFENASRPPPERRGSFLSALKSRAETAGDEPGQWGRRFPGSLQTVDQKDLRLWPVIGEVAGLAADLPRLTTPLGGRMGRCR